MFFVLSGFVIGLTNKTPLTRGTIWTYVKKRLTRIYPIYFLCVTLAVVLALLYPVRHYSAFTVFSNYTFLQVLLSPVIWEDSPIWSLSYEVVYYALFIPLSFYSVNPVKAAVIAFAIGLVNLLLAPQHPLVSSYSFGLAMWLAGVSIARFSRKNETKPTQYVELFGLLFIFLSLAKFNVLDTILLKIGRAVAGKHFEYVGGGYDAMVTFYDFSYLPYFMLLVALFAKRNVWLNKVSTYALVILPVLSFGFIIKNYRQANLDDWVLPSAFYLIGMLFVFVQPRLVDGLAKHVITVLATVGSFSYGLYIVHIPLLVIFNKIDVFTGSAFTFLTRFGLFFAVSLGIAYLLERRYQPYVQAKLLGPPANAK